MKITNIGIYEVSTDTLSCEPLVERTANGELICVSQQGGVGEPSPKNREYVFHSKDNGRTWSDRKSIYPEDGQTVYDSGVLKQVYSRICTLEAGETQVVEVSLLHLGTASRK